MVHNNNEPEELSYDQRYTKLEEFANNSNNAESYNKLKKADKGNYISTAVSKFGATVVDEDYFLRVFSLAYRLYEEERFKKFIQTDAAVDWFSNRRNVKRWNNLKKSEERRNILKQIRGGADPRVDFYVAEYDFDEDPVYHNMLIPYKEKDKEDVDKHKNKGPSMYFQ